MNWYKLLDKFKHLTRKEKITYMMIGCVIGIGVLPAALKYYYSSTVEIKVYNDSSIPISNVMVYNDQVKKVCDTIETQNSKTVIVSRRDIETGN